MGMILAKLTYSQLSCRLIHFDPGKYPPPIVLLTHWLQAIHPVLAVSLGMSELLHCYMQLGKHVRKCMRRLFVAVFFMQDYMEVQAILQNSLCAHDLLHESSRHNHFYPWDQE
jgi:hypothetical protein